MSQHHEYKIQSSDEKGYLEEEEEEKQSRASDSWVFVARNSSNALLSGDFSLNCQVTIVASFYDKRINYR